MTPALLPVHLGVVGLVIGSFLGLISVRLPQGEGVVRGRSYCRACRRTLTWPDLVPVASYVLTRGRCRTCHAAISLKYPLVELAAAGIGISAALAGSTFAEIALTALLGWQLLLIVVIDLEHGWLPKGLKIALLLSGLLGAAFARETALTDWVLGGALGIGASWGLAVCFRRFLDRERGGSGDPVLFAAIGVWTGWQGLPAVVLGACIIGIGYFASAAALAEKPFSDSRRILLAPLLALSTFAWWLWQLYAGLRP